MQDETRAQKIARLNDAFRQTLGADGSGDVLMTQGIAGLPAGDVMQIISKVKTFNAFSEGNDPYGEHDFGNFNHDEHSIYWKIDYYDRNKQFASEDPTEPEQTTRVLTIMLACEY